MPLLSKIRLRYLRRLGFPGYSHIELEIEEEIIIEEGDTPESVERLSLLRMGAAVKSEMQPVVDLYKTTAPGSLPASASTLQAESAASKKTYEAKQAKKAAAGQPTLDEVLDEEPVDLPKDREPGRPMPVFSKEGKRTRNVGQKSFMVAAINAAWVALSEAEIIDSSPDAGKASNDKRGHVRGWLLMTPLDPGFSETELLMVIESYGKWRGQGLTTSEAMLEVGNDYTAHYTGTKQYQFAGDGGDGADDGGDAAPAGAGENLESSEVEDGSGDQDPDADQQPASDPNEQAADDGAGSGEGGGGDVEGEPEAEAEAE